ncbi:guanine nucleotide-binding protein-like 1 [Lingula anatina]|uniref:Guanine nucleotide-binding protein-like 1 n=1 Tax=Lingula anatina TaxID=7574 RepID=A0A1S3JJU1_LINAN|nr:guanine nucleotide-binding protein-like 1 [Lingula anatina]|eukprot:XP_013410174.1 guanine nucleotide-binding protein-like 1 [Lingula anatina]
MPRRKPFSGKLKKKQLQEKRLRLKARKESGSASSDQSAEDGPSIDKSEVEKVKVEKLNEQPQAVDKKSDHNRYKLHFLKESSDEIQRRKREAMSTYVNLLPEESLEIAFDEVFQPGTVLDIPKRPPWNYTLSKEELEHNEEEYFQQYLENIFEQHEVEKLSYFELNLETWRQLWRVLEMSEILLLIVDIRFPVLHFSPALYEHVTRQLGKHVIVVLNKIDLAPPSLVVAWKEYLQKKFPELNIVLFTSKPKDAMERSSLSGKVLQRKRQKRVDTAVGPQQLLDVCESIVKDKVDLSSWRRKVDSGHFDRHEVDSDSDQEDTVASASQESLDLSYQEHERYKDGVLTIGCLGFPNVGKSSLMNALVGRKVVSVSRTPGHTKHFQTIYLTDTVRLCDCPGLVFPSLVPKPLQILSGIYPIAQVREPYSVVGYMAERIPLTHILKIQHSDDEGNTQRWTAWEICDAWAAKRGFLTAKAARNDVYRAANNLLRLALEGRLSLCLRPPGYTAHRDHLGKSS